MRRPTALMKTLRLWRTHTTELHHLAAEGSLDLLMLTAPEVAGIRAQAFDLVRAIDAWCVTHRPQAAASGATSPLNQERA